MAVAGRGWRPTPPPPGQVLRSPVVRRCGSRLGWRRECRIVSVFDSKGVVGRGPGVWLWLGYRSGSHSGCRRHSRASRRATAQLFGPLLASALAGRGRDWSRLWLTLAVSVAVAAGGRSVGAASKVHRRVLLEPRSRTLRSSAPPPPSSWWVFDCTTVVRRHWQWWLSPAVAVGLLFLVGEHSTSASGIKVWLVGQKVLPEGGPLVLCAAASPGQGRQHQGGIRANWHAYDRVVHLSD